MDIAEVKAVIEANRKKRDANKNNWRDTKALKPWQTRGDYFIHKPVDNRLKREVKSPIEHNVLEVSQRTVDKYNRQLHKKNSREAAYKRAVKEYNSFPAADTSDLPNFHAQQQAIQQAGANARMGPAPWTDEFKRVSKKELLKQGVFQTRHGYVQSLGAEWDAKNKPTEKWVTLASGKKAKIIDSHLGVPLGYRGPSEVGYDENDMSSQEYVAKVFDGKHNTYKVDGCGHILELEYSPYYQLLKVHFVKGDSIVVYFRVPTAVFGELFYLAKSKVVEAGSDRHTLGVRFWDLVRIRGTLHGSRYRFEYTQEYTPTGELPGRRPGYSHKYDYETVDKIRGEGTTTIRVPVENTKAAQSQQILDSWDIDNLDDYFDSKYMQHAITAKHDFDMDKYNTDKRYAYKNLQDAKKAYDNGEDAGTIITLLKEAVDYNSNIIF